MNVTFDGLAYSFNVRPGPDGYKDFADQVRVAFNLPDNSDLNITFTCDEPCRPGAPAVQLCCKSSACAVLRCTCSAGCVPVLIKTSILVVPCKQRASAPYSVTLYRPASSSSTSQHAATRGTFSSRCQLQ